MLHNIWRVDQDNAAKEWNREGEDIAKALECCIHRVERVAAVPEELGHVAQERVTYRVALFEIWSRACQERSVGVFGNGGDQKAQGSQNNVFEG